MDKAELAKMTGQTREGAGTPYRLNEVTMNGDTGEFTFREILLNKDAQTGKYPAQPLGESIEGVILKMRWRMFKYEEGADDSVKITTSTEFDNKNTDQVIAFPQKDRGTAINLKERYALGMQRVLYMYLPLRHEVVRVFVKASGLSGDKNPNKEKGLFEYVDEFNKTQTMMHEHFTTIAGVFRKHPSNPRKNHYGMSFVAGRVLIASELEKIVALITEVHEKTTAAKIPVEAPKAIAEDDVGIESEETKVDPNPDDIPF